MQIKINGLQHIGIPVTDLKKSESFYAGLGFTNVMNASFEIKGNTGYVIMMQRDTITMELYQMPEPELNEIRSRDNGHIDHVAFDVDDIESIFATLKANGYPIMESAPVFLNFWQKGCKYFNILGPDGERLEFNQIIK
jgi:lactoylglutathione lyase